MGTSWSSITSVAYVAVARVVGKAYSRKFAEDKIRKPRRKSEKLPTWVVSRPLREV